MQLKDKNMAAIEPTEHARMLIDMERYGDYQEGIYKEYKWNMVRNCLNVWCGYVESGPLEESVFFEVEKHAHAEEITYSWNGKIGFDCGHYMDYSGCLYYIIEKGVYRDYFYVLRCISNMIDYLQKKEK